MDSILVAKIISTLSKYISNLNLANTWKILTNLSYPKQVNNDSDCGVFICQYAKYYAFNRAFDFTQSDIPNKRIELVNEIRKFEINSLVHD